MPDLFIAVDVGSSLTKIIYATPKFKAPQYLLMAPQVQPISRDALKRCLEHKAWFGDPAPQQQAWIELDDQVWAVGDFALSFDPEERLRDKKYENALYKVLAAIGVLVETLSLPTNQVTSVTLAILLPYSEAPDRLLFQEQLQRIVANFRFRGKRLKIRLTEKVLCQPEGGGILLACAKQQPSGWLRSNSIGVLMFGHRNTTALYFEQGEMKHGSSPLLGFSYFLNQVGERSSLLDQQALVKAIFQGVFKLQETVLRTAHPIRPLPHPTHPQWHEVESIQSLSTARNPQLKQAEVAVLCRAIQAATQAYWEKLSRWLDQEFPKKLNTVILSGGAAPFLEPELLQYFGCEAFLSPSPGAPSTKRYSSSTRSQRHIDLFWDANLQHQVQQILKLPERDDLFLASRLVDAFGLFDHLMAKELATKP